MAADHKKAEQDYLEGMKYKDIAEKYGVSLNTVKSWKRRHEWTREKGAPKQERVHTKKQGAPKENKNATGNRGGAPVGNDNASSHGFFRTIFPDDEETLNIVDAISSKGPVNMLWENIVIKYTAIARAQKLMHVQNPQDHAQLLKKEKFEIKNEGTSKEKDYRQYPVERKYEVQFSWDRHANLMTAQSRAMSELRSLIKDFLQLSGKDDQRRLQLEKIQQDIKKTEAEVDQINNKDREEPIEIRIRRKGDNDD